MKDSRGTIFGNLKDIVDADCLISKFSSVASVRIALISIEALDDIVQDARLKIISISIFRGTN